LPAKGNYAVGPIFLPQVHKSPFFFPFSHALPFFFSFLAPTVRERRSSHVLFWLLGFRDAARVQASRRGGGGEVWTDIHCMAEGAHTNKNTRICIRTHRHTNTYVHKHKKRF
jgi:hypothetical protein